MKRNKNFEKNLKQLPPLPKKQLDEMHKIEREAFANFSGQFDELEKAIGMLRVGYYMGWRPLVIIHNKRTLRKYEEILGINIREYFEEEGPASERLYAYKFAKKVGNFWKVVSGDIKVEGSGRRELGQ